MDRETKTKQKLTLEALPIINFNIKLNSQGYEGITQHFRLH